MDEALKRIFHAAAAAAAGRAPSSLAPAAPAVAQATPARNSRRLIPCSSRLLMVVAFQGSLIFDCLSFPRSCKPFLAPKASGVRLKQVAPLSEFVILSRLQAAKNLPWRFPQRDSSLPSE
jgi:hypothetical protein